MRVELTGDIETFWSAAGPILLAEPVLCSVILTNVDRRRAGVIVDPTPPIWAVVRDGSDAVVGAAMWTPPNAPYLSPMPDSAAAALATSYAEQGHAPDGVVAADDVAAAFGDAWTRRTGARGEVEERNRVFTLDEVLRPDAVPGRPRTADAGDRELLLRWRAAFARDVGRREVRTAADLSTVEVAQVEDRIASGRTWLWEDDETPVCYVGATSTIGGVARIAPVYTPPARRGRGYASALVAEVSQRLLDEGARCSLYTDLANPTSNKIYVAVGYRALGDVTRYRFASQPSA